MSNTKLTDFLENKGSINKIQADKVRVEALQGTKTEEKIIIESNLVDELTLVQAKSEIFKIPYVNLADYQIADSLLSQVSGESLRRFKAIPFAQEGSLIKLAMTDPFDIQAIQALEAQFPSGTRLSVYITTAESLNAVLERKVGDVITNEVNAALEDVGEGVTDIDGADDTIDNIDLQNAPVARIVNSILQFAIKSNASDIHIEPLESRLRVRFRIYGVMTEKLSLPKNLTSSVVARLKILANLKIDEKRAPQDGRFPVKTSGHKVDIRVSTVPSVYGEKIVLRLQDTSSGVPKLEISGMRGNAYKLYIDAIKSTNGILLITGPTGSGKTRTLAGTLDKLNDPKVNIISLEDPVEIRVSGVTQIQVNPDVGLTFASGLRSILRQDPDVVMVGEIRDQETAQLAVEASLTGHLVLSTLHTNSAASAIPRLTDMGIEPYLLASTLRLVVAQRLPRKICPYCKEAYLAEPQIQADIEAVLGNISNFNVVDYLNNLCARQNKTEPANAITCPVVGPDGKSQIYLYRGKGCERCGDSGYLGRIGIFEVMKVTEKIGHMMMDSVTAADLEAVAVQDGMIKIIQDGYLKALEGITTVEDVLRVSRE